jgi:hypothetical protein
MKLDVTHAVGEFEGVYKYIRGMTKEFLRGVPSTKWNFSPHPRFAPLCKQARHIVCVQGVYNDGFLSRKVDFSKKHSYYQGALDGEAILVALDKKTAECLNILAGLKQNGLRGFEIDFFGMKMGFGEYCQTIIQHESIHHGQWSLYAALGGFDTPKGWQENWEL